MKQEQHTPHPVLSDHVKCLWAAERHFQPPNDTIEIFPDSYIELVFTFGARFQIDTGSTVCDVPSSYVVGLLDKPFRLRAQGLVKTIAVRFWAWGFFPLMGSVVGQPADAVQEVDATLHRLSAQLGRLMSQHDDHAAIDYLHTFLIERTLSTQFDHDQVQGAARMLLAQRGTVKIEDIAAYCHLSRRQLERKFNAAVGVSPKMLAKKVRFEHVRDRLWQDPHANVAELAYEYGYADQAHFSREFKQISNQTPRQFAANMAATRALLRAQHVAFVQDP